MIAVMHGPASSFDPVLVETLLEVVDAGTFEAAARLLGVSASAVTQRIKALEADVGAVLVRRSTPCSATSAGEPLLRLGRQRRLLQQDVEILLGRPSTINLSVAVQGDSLATWFKSVIAAMATWPHTALRLTVSGGRDTDSVLRRGDAAAAVDTQPHQVPGCTTQTVGHLVYVAVASADLIDLRRSAGDAMRVVKAPSDATMFPELASSDQAAHVLPSAADKLNAVRGGMGWAWIPRQAVATDLAVGRLRRLPIKPVRMPLFLTRWAIETPSLSRLVDEIKTAAPPSG